jgi:hypothetical protein
VRRAPHTGGAGGASGHTPPALSCELLVEGVLTTPLGWGLFFGTLLIPALVLVALPFAARSSRRREMLTAHPVSLPSVTRLSILNPFDRHGSVYRCDPFERTARSVSPLPRIDQVKTPNQTHKKSPTLDLGILPISSHAPPMPPMYYVVYA